MDGYEYSEAHPLPPEGSDNDNNAATRSNNGRTAVHFDEDEYRRPSDEDERGYTGVDSDDRPVLSKVNSFVFSVSLLTVFYVETYGEGVISYPQSPR